MSSSSVNSLPPGAQQLYNRGLLPSSLNASVLSVASAGQLTQLASSSVALQQVNTLLGLGSSITEDTATLSSPASEAFLQATNSTSSSSASGGDVLTQAINNQLTAKLNAAVDKFLPDTSSTPGKINVLG